MKVVIGTLVCAALLVAAQSGQSKHEDGPVAALALPKAANENRSERAAEPAPTTGLNITVDQSRIVQHASAIRRITIANGEIAEAVAVSPTELLINGKAPGETSLIVWDSVGDRTAFEVHVTPNDERIETVRDELRKELGDQDVSLTLQGGTVFLRGTVKDITAADRAFAIASTLGKTINLLRVLVPAAESQILLKVRFADIDRSLTNQLGINLFSANPKGIAQSTTGQVGAPPVFNFSGTANTFSITQLLNIFYYRPDINLGAVLQDLEAKSILQILAEPNLLTVSGRPASFLAGGEFPFPTLQGGAAGVGQITIQFKEFGIRLNFLPTITPRGTIRLLVTPEVSSLDYANGLTVSGYTIPGLSTRRVQTEIELQSGQSFVIAGLLDNQVTESWNRMPGLSSIPLLGKLFQSRSLTKSNTELLVLVTPELIAPVPVGIKVADPKMPLPFMNGTAPGAPQSPGPAVTGPPPPLSKRESLPIEEMKSLNDMSNGNSGPKTSLPPLGIQPILTLQPPDSSNGAPPQPNSGSLSSPNGQSPSSPPATSSQSAASPPPSSAASNHQ